MARVGLVCIVVSAGLNQWRASLLSAVASHERDRDYYRSLDSRQFGAFVLGVLILALAYAVLVCVVFAALCYAKHLRMIDGLPAPAWSEHRVPPPHAQPGQDATNPPEGPGPSGIESMVIR